MAIGAYLGILNSQILRFFKSSYSVPLGILKDSINLALENISLKSLNISQGINADHLYYSGWSYGYNKSTQEESNI